ncbi:hypothetical protein Egran_03802 [Elaphomyces granulatus]|uniref:Uncharacterized protein n=1 Tax=Elaphomyces granulatus TaxID=519963 RepID=A0A232LWI4_9EURO|nr:hypothetical protein Egran_03802 [Elaphomyces granulatus]
MTRERSTPTGSWVTFTTVTQCAFQKSIEGVIVPEEMDFDVLFNNWQGVRLLPGALFEARGTVTIEGDRPVSAYLRKEKSSGLALSSVFDIHCVFAGTASWGNTWVPRVGSATLRTGADWPDTSSRAPRQSDSEVPETLPE